MSSKPKFLISLILCLGGGWLTGFITESGVHDWYPGLIKSPLTPPNILFPIVWSLLYTLLAISLYLVWEKPESDKTKRLAFTVFGIQLFLNFSWSWFFFYFHLPGAALVDILLLLTAIVLMIRSFYKISRIAAILQIPYLVWVLFASYLNLFIWLHN